MSPRLPALLALTALLALPASPAQSDSVLRHEFTLQGVTAQQPLRPDGGGYDWDWRGPRDDPEWSWFFNRHGWFPELQAAYQKTGDTRYLHALLDTLDDWIVTHPAPGRITFSAAWRPLEAARRLVDSWLVVMPAAAQSPLFTPERRERYRTSLAAHGEHLRRHHAFGGNHLVTEMLALVQLALAEPELPGASEWLAYGLDQLALAYDDQVYPDGSHKELSAHYQRVIALNYQRLLVLLDTAGRPELADAWRPRVQRLWRYFIAIMRPDGGNPLNNDSDQENILHLLQQNAPRLAALPDTTHWLPHAGQAVFRSGRDTSAWWAFFDTGPRGTDHDHADRLHFSLSLGTRPFLVDNGRYTYRPGPWRDYFAGPAGHNVLLLDGAGSAQGPRAVRSPDSLGRFFMRETFEVARGDASFASGANPRAADWRRIVVHVRDHGWIVIDRLIVFQPVALTTLWHWHPACETLPSDDPSAQLIRHDTAALRLHVASSATGGAWRTALGETGPVQGWHSERFNFKTPAPCTLYTQRTARPVTNVWLFAPSAPQPSRDALAVNFNATGTLAIRAHIAGASATLAIDPEKPESAALTTDLPSP